MGGSYYHRQDHKIQLPSDLYSITLELSGTVLQRLLVQIESNVLVRYAFQVTEVTDRDTEYLADSYGLPEYTSGVFSISVIFDLLMRLSKMGLSEM